MSETTYTYAQPSALTIGAEGQSPQLAAWAKNALTGSAARFVPGQSRDSWLTARALTTLAKVLASHSVPQTAALCACIVTASAGQWCFKALSSCDGGYTRLDLGLAALDGEFGQNGTTAVWNGLSSLKTLNYTPAYQTTAR